MSSSEKVAILTLYYDSTNYGGILQAYALQSAIQELGFTAVQISYQLESGYQKKRRKISLLSVPGKLMERYQSQAMLRKRKRRDEKILEFAHCIPHTKEVTAETISQLNADYDTFICGSDQIWNPIGWQPTLFLDFVQPEKVKMAYAASMARDVLTPNQMQFLEYHLKGFNAISVREQNSIPLIKKSGVEQTVELMPDPVFLRTAEQWKELASKVRMDEPYLFAYFLGEDISHRESAKDFAKQNGVKLQYIPYLNSKAYRWDVTHKEDAVNNVGIPEFLELIMNAKAVITDSFHGAAFSILFGKRLILLDRFNKNDTNSMNSRLETLFAQTKMNLEEHQTIPSSVEDIEVPGAETVEALREMRNMGLSYLKKLMGNNT